MTEPSSAQAYLDSTRASYDTVAADYAALLADTGFALDARLVRGPDERERPTQGEQAFFLATRAS